MDFKSSKINESDYNLVFHKWRFRRGCPCRRGVSRLDEIVSKVTSRASYKRTISHETI